MDEKYEKYKTFTPLNVSSKFAICGLPLRVDTYKTCSFGCSYCFSNGRKIMEFEKTLQVANNPWLERKLKAIYHKQQYKNESFLDCLLINRITWHCGGMSDPFQPCEKNLKITKDMLDITNEHNIRILFSTKSDNVYECDIRPDLHTFQLSVTNIEGDCGLERNVPTIENRFSFYRMLKQDGFKVGIRIQPFIPGITKDNIIDMFNDADYFTIEGIKLVPQNKEQKELVLDACGLGQESFTQMGLLNLKPDIRMREYKSFIDKLKKYSIPYSIADNDLHYMSNGKCCCGDTIIQKSTGFDNTALLYEYGKDYTLENVLDNLSGYKQCKANQLFTSNRQEGCVTVKDFFEKRFDRASSPFSPKFLYYEEDNTP